MPGFHSRPTLPCSTKPSIAFILTSSATICETNFADLLSRLSSQLSESNTVTTVDSLRLPTFKQFSFSLPKDIVEQRAIATVLSDMDAEIVALEQRRDKISAVRKGMMQQLLSGRVRLVETER